MTSSTPYMPHQNDAPPQKKRAGLPFEDEPQEGEGLLQRLLQQATFPPRLQWFSGFTLLLAGVVIWLSAFITLSLPTLLPSPDQSATLHTFSYSVQWLTVVAVYTVLGTRMATVVWAGLILCSLVLPVFSNGGGIAFLIQPGVLFIPASLISVTALSTQWERSTFRMYRKPLRINPQKRVLWLLVKAALISFWCCFAFHFFLACGLGLFTVFQLLTVHQAKLWWLTHSWHPFIYDVLFTTLILLGFQWLRVSCSPLLFPALAFTGSAKKLPAYEEAYPEAAQHYGGSVT